MILCCGEALIDMLPAATADGQTTFVPHAGGAVFNTAIALGRLGLDAGLLTGLSTDMFGAQLVAALADSHVDTGLAVRSDRPSTLAFVQLVDGQARYNFYDENSAGRMLTDADMPAVPDQVSALFFGGISLACEPAADAYADLLAREGGPRAVMLDPNIRPGFIEDATRYRARLNAMLAHTDIVKVSDEDLAWILPDSASEAERVATLRKRGPAVVIVTRGSDGATGYLADGAQVQVPAAQVTVVDTVGAGDTFNAGVLAKLARTGHLSKDALASLSGDALQQAMAFGAKVAGVTVSRAGANPPWAHDL
ncbi:carbohydrate kinase family protein [Thalassorhabdomicrobium marinisediminis]|uniref:Carbohydrate kinase n=1 Tax=Thalassorhabdomicrobium marinisediminis TaxID=2170577 RepID=A0A2T7FWH3_9RHOB|nr:carbohydrate kinase [Thalassorhabdomicrobium marinisediminis]PVA06515.1 carbohydrate kinase [Thalassorhabdomicrobium marinisediminis]